MENRTNSKERDIRGRVVVYFRGLQNDTVATKQNGMMSCSLEFVLLSTACSLNKYSEFSAGRVTTRVTNCNESSIHCCRIVFEGNFAPSPVGFYDYSLLVYTFGKSTLAPGERLGYIALSPRMKPEDREAMRESITRACMTGNISDSASPF